MALRAAAAYDARLWIIDHFTGMVDKSDGTKLF
jgi:hypothetical protein